MNKAVCDAHTHVHTEKLDEHDRPHVNESSTDQVTIASCAEGKYKGERNFTNITKIMYKKGTNT